jgi:hypothetical protein
MVDQYSTARLPARSNRDRESNGVEGIWKTAGERLLPSGHDAVQCSFGGSCYLHLQGTMKVELVPFYHTTRRHALSDDNLQIHRRESLKSHIQHASGWTDWNSLYSRNRISGRGATSVITKLHSSILLNWVRTLRQWLKGMMVYDSLQSRYQLKAPHRESTTSLKIKMMPHLWNLNDAQFGNKI